MVGGVAHDHCRATGRDRLVALGAELLERRRERLSFGRRLFVRGHGAVAQANRVVAVAEQRVALGRDLIARTERSVAFGQRGFAGGSRGVELRRELVAGVDRGATLGQRFVAGRHRRVAHPEGFRTGRRGRIPFGRRRVPRLQRLAASLHEAIVLGGRGLASLAGGVART
ncbi:MAG: hypothetical protein JO325_11445 [Solirubrobacterales bacterium]|nr:hypothetical protein [Solirubrobacterales bacterium]